MALTVALTASLLLVVSTAAQEAVTHDGDPLLISLKQGQLRGVAINGSRVFRGIPYAAPPVGDGRWRPPQAHGGWTGVRDASNFGFSCVSPECWDTEDVSRTSEDCLLLNVIAPSAPGSYPVMVYIHAGEFHCGSSNDAESNWPNFADDVVFVSMNYRLGVFGFLGSEDLRLRHPRGGTGNYGLLDQRQALQWTRDNIAAFGGDPSRITVWGESSGGASVAFHLIANGSQPTDLFQSAILQSPGLTQVKSLADAEQNYEWLLAHLAAVGSPGCPHGPGYVAFPQVRIGVSDERTVLATHKNQSASDSQAWCDRVPLCMGFYQDGQTLTTTFVARGRSAYPEDVESFPHARETRTFLKEGPTDQKLRSACLIAADATLLDELTEFAPRDDTFQTDAWAPVIDGVDLLQPILDSIEQGKIASGVKLLVGTNLDEGTEFMFLTPKLACNASSADLWDWAVAFHGPDLAAQVSHLYKSSSLARPLPACGPGDSPEDLPGEAAVNYNAAMRSAGDAAIRCPTALLAERATADTFVYMFSLTPAHSANFGNTSVLGAFHGAEVPFVFKDTFELTTEHERFIADAMACRWRSFAWHGDPSVETCPGGALWPKYNKLARPVLNFGDAVALQFSTLVARARCHFFTQSEAFATIGATRDTVVV